MSVWVWGVPKPTQRGQQAPSGLPRLRPGCSRHGGGGDAAGIPSSTGARQLERGSLMAELIATNGLTKRFGGLTAVNQVDFSVHEGDAAGVIGPNGSGKTTLFNLLSGFFPPTEGTISFEGQDVTHLPPHRRVGLGMSRTFQLVSVFPSLSTWENLVLSCLRFKDHQASGVRFFFRRSQDREIVEDCHQALQSVGLEDKAPLPTSQLSYGDKRKLEIAMALSLKPKLLLL